MDERYSTTQRLRFYLQPWVKVKTRVNDKISLERIKGVFSKTSKTDSSLSIVFSVAVSRYRRYTPYTASLYNTTTWPTSVKDIRPFCTIVRVFFSSLTRQNSKRPQMFLKNVKVSWSHVRQSPYKISRVIPTQAATIGVVRQSISSGRGWDAETTAATTYLCGEHADRHLNVSPQVEAARSRIWSTGIVAFFFFFFHTRYFLIVIITT